MQKVCVNAHDRCYETRSYGCPYCEYPEKKMNLQQMAPDTSFEDRELDRLRTMLYDAMYALGYTRDEAHAFATYKEQTPEFPTNPEHYLVLRLADSTRRRAYILRQWYKYSWPQVKARLEHEGYRNPRPSNLASETQKWAYSHGLIWTYHGKVRTTATIGTDRVGYTGKRLPT